MLEFSEDTYEQVLIELFQTLGGKQFRYQYGPDIDRENWEYHKSVCDHWDHYECDDDDHF